MEEGRGKREEGRGKREEGRGKREDGDGRRKTETEDGTRKTEDGKRAKSQRLESPTAGKPSGPGPRSREAKSVCGLEPKNEWTVKAARRRRENEPANEARRRGGPPVGAAFSPSPSGRGVGVRAPATHAATARRSRNQPLPRRNPGCPAELHVRFARRHRPASSWHRLEPLSLRERVGVRAPATHVATVRHSRNQPLPRRNPRIFSRVCTSVCAAPSTVPPVGTVWSPSPSGRGVGVRAPAPTPQRHATRAINRFRAGTPECPAELHVGLHGAIHRPGRDDHRQPPKRRRVGVLTRSGPPEHGGRSFAHEALLRCSGYSPSVSSEALPPAAVVLMVTVFSVVKRGR